MRAEGPSTRPATHACAPRLRVRVDLLRLELREARPLGGEQPAQVGGEAGQHGADVLVQDGGAPAHELRGARVGVARRGARVRGVALEEGLLVLARVDDASHGRHHSFTCALQCPCVPIPGLTIRPQRGFRKLVFRDLLARFASEG